MNEKPSMGVLILIGGLFHADMESQIFWER